MFTLSKTARSRTADQERQFSSTFVTSVAARAKRLWIWTFRTRPFFYVRERDEFRRWIDEQRETSIGNF